jgi:hypothetical protein
LCPCCTQALAAALAPKAKALRDGKVETIDSVNLVPGDVIIVRLGDIVPADIKILQEDEEGNQEDETPMSVRAVCCSSLRFLACPDTFQWPHVAG